MVPNGGFTLIYGLEKCGKSYLSLGLALAISNPKIKEWFGKPVCTHGPVMYLQVDTPREEWGERVETLIGAGHDVSNIYFTDALEVPYPPNILAPGTKESLKETIMAIKPVALFVDTLREIHEEDENSNTDMKRVISALHETAIQTGTAVILVAHSRKGIANTHHGKTSGDDADNASHMSDNRGASYVTGRMDAIAKLTEKHLMLKGRAIVFTKIPIERDPIGLVVMNSEKAEMTANIKMVLGRDDLKTKKQKAELLAVIEEIEVDAAIKRINRYEAKQKETTKNGRREADE